MEDAVILDLEEPATPKQMTPKAQVTELTTLLWDRYAPELFSESEALETAAI